MASPGYGSPSIKQIIHHGSEEQRSATSDPESFTRGPGAPNRAFGEVPTANLTEGANREPLGISVEPFLSSASPQNKLSWRGLLCRGPPPPKVCELWYRFCSSHVQDHFARSTRSNSSPICFNSSIRRKKCNLSCFFGYVIYRAT